MPYEFLEHSGDIKMRVEGKTMEELFSDAFAGMIRILRPLPGKDQPYSKFTINIKSHDSTALLIDFLNAVLLNIHKRKISPESIIFEKLTPVKLKVKISGPPLAELEEDIKAVTYHQADVRQVGRGWETLIIFDI